MNIPYQRFMDRSTRDFQVVNPIAWSENPDLPPVDFGFSIIKTPSHRSIEFDFLFHGKWTHIALGFGTERSAIDKFPTTLLQARHVCIAKTLACCINTLTQRQTIHFSFYSLMTCFEIVTPNSFHFQPNAYSQIIFQVTVSEKWPG